MVTMLACHTIGIVWCTRATCVVRTGLIDPDFFYLMLFLVFGAYAATCPGETCVT